MEGQRIGSAYGTHRVLEPVGVLPQPAWKLNCELPIYDTEVLIDVHRLNIDSASFRQLRKEAHDDVDRLKENILKIISDRGKMHNPVTGSGGMLIGTVEEVGGLFSDPSLAPGMKIATLVSLTLTPLCVTQIHDVDMKTGQIEVSGKAILFASGPFAVLPEDLSEAVSLAALDVCGAPAQVARMVKAKDVVLVMGAGGKSGLLSLYHAWKIAGKEGVVIAVEYSDEACEELENLPFYHHLVQIDATNPLTMYEEIACITEGKMVDLTINCVNVPGTELSAILATRDGGVVYFFSMAVQFTTAALGAEGVGKDVHMMIGNGYAPGHAAITLDTLRESEELRTVFCRKFLIEA